MYLFDVIQKEGQNANGPSNISLCTLTNLNSAELRIETGMGKKDDTTLLPNTSIELKINGVKTDTHTFFNADAEKSSKHMIEAQYIHSLFTAISEAAENGVNVFNLADQRPKIRGKVKKDYGESD